MYGIDSNRGHTSSSGVVYHPFHFMGISPTACFPWLPPSPYTDQNLEQTRRQRVEHLNSSYYPNAPIYTFCSQRRAHTQTTCVASPQGFGSVDGHFYGYEPNFVPAFTCRYHRYGHGHAAPAITCTCRPTGPPMFRSTPADHFGMVPRYAPPVAPWNGLGIATRPPPPVTPRLVINTNGQYFLHYPLLVPLVSAPSHPHPIRMLSQSFEAMQLSNVMVCRGIGNVPVPNYGNRCMCLSAPRRPPPGYPWGNSSWMRQPGQGMPPPWGTYSFFGTDHLECDSDKRVWNTCTVPQNPTERASYANPPQQSAQFYGDEPMPILHDYGQQYHHPQYAPRQKTPGDEPWKKTLFEIADENHNIMMTHEHGQTLNGQSYWATRADIEHEMFLESLELDDTVPELPSRLRRIPSQAVGVVGGSFNGDESVAYSWEFAGWGDVGNGPPGKDWFPRPIRRMPRENYFSNDYHLPRLVPRFQQSSDFDIPFGIEKTGYDEEEPDPLMDELVSRVIVDFLDLEDTSNEQSDNGDRSSTSSSSSTNSNRNSSGGGYGMEANEMEGSSSNNNNRVSVANPTTGQVATSSQQYVLGCASRSNNGSDESAITIKMLLETPYSPRGKSSKNQDLDEYQILIAEEELKRKIDELAAKDAEKKKKQGFDDEHKPQN